MISRISFWGDIMKEVQYIFDRNKEIAAIPDGIVVIGKDCCIIVFNEAASRMTGFSDDEIVTKNCEVLFHKTKDELNFIRESIAENRTFSNHPINITTKNNEIINVLASITPIKKSGEVTGVVFVFRNTNETLSLSDDLASKTLELIDERNKLEAIFNSNIEGTFTIDDEWNITSFNNSAAKITGYKKEDALGQKCWNIFNSNLCRNGCHMEQTMHRGKSTIGNELEIIQKYGNRLPIRVNSAILLNNKNEKIGAVETFIDISEIKNLSAHLDERYSYENIIGKNKEIKKIISVLESVAQTDSSVLLTGESGTGKELAARAIHLKSIRRTGPFIAVNCSAFVETLIESELFGHEKGAFTGAIKTKTGRFELAKGGTLFLDEIGDLSLAIQTKLLRVLETHEFERVGGTKNIKMDCRIIVATNKNLNEEIQAGKFRGDLFYRINIINIHLPPLRERKDDLPLLVSHIIEHFNEKFGKSVKQFSSPAYELITEYEWPGNIRELENVIEHCFILCSSSIIQTEHLPKSLREVKIKSQDKSSAHIKKNMMETEREIILSALEKNKWNRRQTAGELKVNPSTLWRKMKKLGIK
jgi:PAS domain S-box-containing protein